MSNKIIDLVPDKIWKHFYDLTRIPRPSGHEKQVINHLKKFADQQDLESKIDATGNLIIRKKPFPGREKIKPVILQAHVDMVPQKNSNKVHDFLTDPIETIVDGEWVRANQTTLGADNGIGIAAILSVLESDNIQHGPLEALFTISEETGMDGAFGLNEDDLKGNILLNLDSEDEGELFIGCAGGIDVNINWNYEPADFKAVACYKIALSGLKGGHSGIDINLGRANANRVMVKMLDDLSKQIPFCLVSFSGGNLRNAIPRESEAVIGLDDDDLSKLNSFIDTVVNNLKIQFKGVEDNISLRVEPVKSCISCMDSDDRQKFINLILKCPDGVIAMSESIPGVVQTSNNIAVIKAEQGKIEVKTLLRSSFDKEKMEMAEKIGSIFTQEGAKVEITNGYPGWLPDRNSEILRFARETYLKEFAAEPRIKVIHAGLECGIIGAKISGLDMISFGPTISHPHSPDEKVYIGSVKKFWQFLKALLESVE